MKPTLVFLVLSMVYVNCMGQSEQPMSKEYRIIDKFPFYARCVNCKIEKRNFSMTCGHQYKYLSATYSYDGDHWVGLGFTFDNTSCLPEKGTDLFGITLLVKIDRRVSIGINIHYFRDNLFGLQFYFLKYGVNLEGITDYNSFGARIRPEIRIGDNMDFSRLLNRVQVAYGYNIDLTSNELNSTNNHQVTIIIKIFNWGWFS